MTGLPERDELRRPWCCPEPRCTPLHQLSAKPVSPLGAMIDAATGRYETQARELMDRISALRAEYDAEVSP